MGEYRNRRDFFAEGLVGAIIGGILGAILGAIAVQSSLDSVSQGIRTGVVIGTGLGWIGGLFAFIVSDRWWFDFHNLKGGLAIGLIGGAGLGGILGLFTVVGEISSLIRGIGYSFVDMIIVLPFLLVVGALIGGIWGIIWGIVTKYLLPPSSGVQ
ncbi:MAG: hypothetical protein HC804_14115 [Anaerolineae bacterium]|nr:hypothetical protein [Anaerolineae bacterium]